MNWKALLFSPRGRLNRAKFWLVLVGSYAVLFAAEVPFATTGDDNRFLSPGRAIYLWLIGILSFVVLYVGIMISIKRFHDRGKSGFWVLISFVPFIGAFWYLIECGFLRGTVGRNRFGPDPLAPNDDIVEVFGDPKRTTLG